MTQKSSLPHLLRLTALVGGIAAASLLKAQAQPAAPAATPAAAAAPETPAPAAKPALPVVGTKVLPTPDRGTPIGGTITGLLDSSHAVSTIQRQELDSRAPLLEDMTQRMATVDQQLAESRQKANPDELTGDSKKDFDQSWKDYQKAKAKLEQSVEAARNADAKAWERVRSTLATDYAFYAAAVAGVEVATPSS
ncbi:hypothetical protein DB347_15610 [Opitutaceae bacterium EW11]|nr:hypothetical protein DB347_15610 [Opitutaceae bacterium EW11]